MNIFFRGEDTKKMSFREDITTFINEYTESGFNDKVKQDYITRLKSEHLLSQVKAEDQQKYKIVVRIIEKYDGKTLTDGLQKHFLKNDGVDVFNFEPLDDDNNYYGQNKSEIDALKEKYNNFAKPKEVYKSLKELELSGFSKSNYLEAVKKLNKVPYVSGIHRGIILLHKMRTNIPTFRGSYGKRTRSLNKSNRARNRKAISRKSMRRTSMRRTSMRRTSMRRK